MRRTVALLLALAAVASVPWWLPEAMMGWTDYTIHHAAKHLARVKAVGNIGTPDDYWYAAADLAYYVTGLITLVGIAGTIVVVLYGARQVRVATSSMRSTARQQQMRLLFDLDLALLNNPELMALTEGHFALDTVTLTRAKSSAFAHAFLNGCDTIYDYYKLIDPDEANRYWLAWRAQLCYYMANRPELRAMARESIDRGFYTDHFRAELSRLLEEAEKRPDTRHIMPPVVVATPDPMPSGAPNLRELSDSDSDAATLRLFYASVYVREFPDPDERESLANMETYLRVRKPKGWYGKNNYHIIVAELAGRTAALCVADYVADANVGIIEFLVVVPEVRGFGLGHQMMDYIESLFVADARRAHGTHLRGIVAEMNDPFRAALLDDNMDPFDRALLWHGWGFRLLDMPYVQPPLSEAQGPVECLVLIARPLLPPFDEWPADAVLALIRDYLIYAMRFENPATNPHFVTMARWLAGRTEVPLRSLAAFVGREPAIPWIEVRDRRDTAFVSAMRLYRSAFEGNISISDEDFAVFLDVRSSPGLRYVYHLWVARHPVGDEVLGLASFFTFGHCGFGGYTVRRRIPRPDPDIPFAVGIASVEERMRRDNPNIEGWFIECNPQERKQPASIFYRYGFREVAIEYRQPPLPGSPYDFKNAAVLNLLYKPFGSRFRAPTLSVGTFLAAMEDVFRVVYDVAQPTRSPYHLHLRSQLPTDGAALVPFHVESPRRRRA